MTVKSITSALKINGKALFNAKDVEEVETYLAVIDHLAYDLHRERDKEHAASTAEDYPLKGTACHA